MPDPLVELRVLEDAATVARAGAEHVAARVATLAADRERVSFAVSGGRTPWLMFDDLAGLSVPWDVLDVFQVDERVVAPGPDRNLTRLADALPAQARVHAMPVEADDLDAAAADYAALLPARLDLVHLGLGADGHTASLVPGDPVLDVSDRDVALTAQPYQGTRRMTLTFPVLDAAVEVLWVVTGADKADALRALLDADPAVPAGRVRAARQLVLADRAAAGG